MSLTNEEIQDLLQQPIEMFGAPRVAEVQAKALELQAGGMGPEEIVATLKAMYPQEWSFFPVIFIKFPIVPSSP
jgi:hypothetical protein